MILRTTMDVLPVQLGEVQPREVEETTDKMPLTVFSVWNGDGALNTHLSIHSFDVHVLQVRYFPLNTQYLYTHH